MQGYIRNNKIRSVSIVGFMSFLLVVGVLFHKDYGIWIDEPTERISGIVSLNYVAQKLNITSALKDPVLKSFSSKELGPLHSYRDRDYPVLFSLVAVVLERVFQIDDEQEIYFFRHLLNYLTCLIGVFAIYKLAERRFASWKIGILAATFFILTPRMFAESFYNSKDLIFLAAFAVATYTLISFIQKPGIKLALWHGLATGLAMNARIMAVMIIAATLVALGLRLARKELTWHQIRFPVLLYILASLLVTIAFWPWLWTHTLEHFVQAFASMSKFVRGPNVVGYLGETVEVTQLPWHYALVWIGITTPITYLVLFFIGLSLVIKSIIANHLRIWSSPEQLQDLIFLGIFITPLIAVIALDSVIYNGWRQLYFIYPAFLMIVMKAWVWIYDSTTLAYTKSRFTQKIIKSIKPALIILTGTTLVYQTHWMYRAHPFQLMYFNELAGKDAATRFEGDFGGLTGRNALEWIVAYDQSPIIRIFGVWHTFFLSPKDRARIFLVDALDKADYGIDSSNMQFKLVHQIYAASDVIASIYERISHLKPYDPISKGQIITFSKNSSGVQYLNNVGEQAFIGYGWSNPETWGVWSDGNKASLILPLPESKANELIILGRPFVGTSHPEQRLRVRINGIYTEPITLSSPSSGTIKIQLTPRMLQRNYLAVEFIFLNPIEPFALNGSNDHRKLAFGLQEIVFK
jgi:hypothetical protein